ncbi:serine/threonine-protein phosphatase 4 regulatory subunit 2 [Coffea eugenioides]|uniref:Uncharacterized protein n=1 Tax=Coffea arabica TaxID=13443 RepID=A0A6P6SWD5_COFAR|nr:serine/threonine-protein phosphatase 4 regulatory subunit 2-like [Coffea arabica]XP_027176009.1 serine/threonine-protein phosphatase 4 regulatory subunit 2 [Coffea eugenioides]
MPLYDCMLLLKPHVTKEALLDLAAKVGKHVYRRNGVLTDIKSFGQVQLGYGIRKLDGRYYQGRLMQMTMMTPPSFNEELHYLNKEDRLLRWLLVKHRDMKYGLDFLGEGDPKADLRRYGSSLLDNEDDKDDSEDEDDDDEYDADQGHDNDEDDDGDDDDEDDEDEYEADQGEKKEG